MNNDARNILGLDNNKEDIDTLVSKEDGMSYIRDLNRVRSKQDSILENDSLKYQLNSISIANEAVTNDMILESERLQLVKELMVSENGISLESAEDILNKYMDGFFNRVDVEVETTDSNSKRTVGVKVKQIEYIVDTIKKIINKIWDWILVKSRELYLFITRTKIDITELRYYYSTNNDQLKNIVRQIGDLGKNYVYADDAIDNPKYDILATPIYETIYNTVLKTPDVSVNMNNIITEFESQKSYCGSFSRGYYGDNLTVMNFINTHSRILSPNVIKSEIQSITQKHKEINSFVRRFTISVLKSTKIISPYKDGKVILEQSSDDIQRMKLAMEISKIYAKKINELYTIKNYMNELTIYMIKNKKKEV